ncbi:formate dehydrogenase accessory protein FdhE [uncultured Sutterella sp.]|uniref:formate dehydrogenase accessory protein FdhE n=1 Tax=uncultured Sutterella sp. TaxID=286133 RepID=UPI0025E47FA5|nr:formate dehydrogenase accessory protein FdhE [uncultured Sutterella sp.]
MTPKSIERALERYRAYKDEDVRGRLKAFGPLILESAVLANELTDADLKVLRDPTDEELMAAAKGGETILGLGLVEINPESFKRDLKRMGHVLLNSLEASDAFRAAAEQFSWAPFAEPGFVRVAEADPMGALSETDDMIAGLSPELVDVWALPVLGLTLRAYLDRFANEISGRLIGLEERKPSYSRRLTCFCCGADPDVAAVSATNNHGNVKKLYCGACGARWTFERIRCARCGDDAVSDLSYVSDESDDSHRLHVCAACHAAMPTLFAPGDDLTFQPDVESIVLTGLEEAYKQAVLEGTVPEKVLKEGDATVAGRGPGKGMV